MMSSVSQTTSPALEANMGGSMISSYAWYTSQGPFQQKEAPHLTTALNRIVRDGLHRRGAYALTHGISTRTASPRHFLSCFNWGPKFPFYRLGPQCPSAPSTFCMHLDPWHALSRHGI
jgi:hypothetical protein